MAQSPYEYGKWVEDALRQVVRRALEQASDGLTGKHHFYITFRTDAPGVEIPAHLHKQYPREMTILLQNQFWGLKALAAHFEVTLSFNRVNETLSIPYSALTAFADPSVEFGLQLQMTEPKGPPIPKLPAEEKPIAKKPLPAGVAEIKKSLPAPAPAPAAKAKPEAADDTAKKSGQVVAIDAFRKK
jgi:hypothetical protein